MKKEALPERERLLTAERVSDQEADGALDGDSTGAALGTVVDGRGLTVGDGVVVVFVQPPTASAATRASKASSDFMARSPVSWGVHPTLGRAASDGRFVAAPERCICAPN